jgi:hypothetical protein
MVSVVLDRLKSKLAMFCVQAFEVKSGMPAANPAYPLASYLLARHGHKSTGKRSENYSGRDTKSPESTSVMVGADPLAARELPIAIILPRQGNFLPNLTASGRSFYLAASLPSPRKPLAIQPETTSDSDAGHPRPIFQKMRHDAGG